MAAYRRVYDSRLTAKNRDQLRNPTLGNAALFTGLSIRPLLSKFFCFLLSDGAKWFEYMKPVFSLELNFTLYV